MPSAPCTFTLVTDPEQVLQLVEPLVATEPEALSVLASVTRSLVVDPGRHLEPRWWVGTDASGQVVAAAMHTPPHQVHIALATPDQARTLAAGLADLAGSAELAGSAGLAGRAERADLPGVGGLRAPAEAFADEWTARTGASATVAMEVGRFGLPTRPRVPFAVAGRYRVAEPGDMAVVDAWHQQFVDAVEGGGRRAGALTEHLADGRIGLWEDAGRLVSMAYASPASGGVTRISGVWTPPALRGHGYASALVAALSRARQDAGEACMLYTDLANPTSNAIYRAVGYRRVGDSISIAFNAATCSTPLGGGSAQDATGT
jgi:hypothetical protein